MVIPGSLSTPKWRVGQRVRINQQNPINNRLIMSGHPIPGTTFMYNAVLNTVCSPRNEADVSAGTDYVAITTTGSNNDGWPMGNFPNSKVPAAITASVWINNITTNSADKTLIQVGTSVNLFFGLRGTTNGTRVPMVYNNGFRVGGTTVLGTVTRNQPYHLVGQLWFEADDCAAIYVDGVQEVRSIDYAGGYVVGTDSCVGDGHSSGSWGGVVCRYYLAEIWGRLLTDAEINYLYKYPYGTVRNPRFLRQPPGTWFVPTTAATPINVSTISDDWNAL